MSEKSEKLRLPLSHSPFLKALAFILAMIFFCAAAAGGIATAFCLNYGLYYRDEQELREELLADSAAGYYPAWLGLHGDLAGLEEFIEQSNIALVQVKVYGELEGTHTVGAYSGGERFQRFYGYHSVERAYNDGYADIGETGYDLWYEGISVPESRENYIVVTVWLDSPMTVYDEFYWLSLALELACDWCWWFIALCVGGLLGFVLCLVFLLRSAGRRPGRAEPCESWATKIPFDLATAALAAVFAVMCLLLDSFYWENDIVTLLSWAFLGLLALALLLWWLMGLALRIKLGRLIRGSFVWWLLCMAWRMVRCCVGFILRAVKAAGRFAAAFFRRLSIVWWAALAVCGLALVEFVVIMATESSLGAEVLLWLLKTLLLLAAAVFLAFMLRELQRMGRALAQGDMSVRADTRFMPAPLKAHAEDLSSIGDGINRAVAQRMKSERMKTELITNVSHDIKTPLTSIINYADLISREQTENEKIVEYALVLQRQGVRLKRLLEDLVEASKASSGNMEINLAPCQAGVMLMQAAGEYEQRLQQQGLSLVAGQPVHEVCIMADGRRLWRVMDNLLSNICKYAMPGTRVFLSLEDVGGQAVISFKNTSREPLNLSPEELSERFVRGDSARQGEGSGLGLSIAKSLTELQGGSMEISCDGDLFKVILKFPVVK